MFEEFKFELLALLMSVLFGSIVWRHNQAREKKLSVISGFKDSFIPTVSKINRTNKIPEIYQTFCADFHAQETAMHMVRNIIKGKTRRAFDEKWAEYNNINNECRNYGMCVVIVSTSGHEIIELINELIAVVENKA